MISQVSDAIRKRLMHHGVCLSVDFILRQRSEPYISRKLFVKYFNTIFVSCLNELLESEEFEACEAMLLMDNYSSHVSDDAVAILINIQMQIITFTPHTTQIFQMFDIVLFCVLKKHATNLKSLHEEQPATALLLKVYHDFKQIMIEVDISRAFLAIGFTHDIEQSPYGLLFDEEQS
jgi:hypothetical protein